MAIEQQFNNIEDLISNSELPLLLVFSSPWSGPSQLMNSVLEQVDAHLKQQLQIVKIDSEKNSGLSDRYQVHALPTLLIFKHGQLAGRIEEERTENLLPAAHLIQRLQAILQ